MRWPTALLLVLTCAAARAAPPDLSWLSGDWRRCKDGEIVEERWLGPRGGLMIGANLTSSKSGRTTWELLRLVRSDDGWTYWAAPMGRPPTPFRLVESGAQRAVFGNAENAFPSRLVYWRDGDELLARIEGTLRERPAAEEWRFARGTAADCPP